VQNVSTRPTTMSSTPRFAFSNSACLKAGVLFQSASNDSATAGPGYYSVPRNDFLKRSYNVRVRGTENRTRSASNTPVTTPINSPTGIRPATQVRQLSTPRGSYRPNSAGAGPSPTPLSAAAAPRSPMPLTSPAKVTTGAARPTTPTGTPNGSVAGSQASQNGQTTARSTPGSAATRPRSASAGATSRISGNRSTPTATPTPAGTTTPNGSANHNTAQTTPRSAAVAGRGRGLFSEHGSLDKPKTQQQWQAEQGQPANGHAVANGKPVSH
jgi:hypothetical protein